MIVTLSRIPAYLPSLAVVHLAVIGIATHPALAIAGTGLAAAMWTALRGHKLPLGPGSLDAE